MNNLSLYNPTLDVKDIDEWMGGFFKPFRSSLTDLVPSIKLTPGLPVMDVVENETGSTVTMELPGMKKSDINISINDNEVTISATTKKESEKKDGDRVVRSERYYGNIYRRFALSHTIDEAKSVAKYENGILTLTMPKTAEGRTMHKLPVL